MTSKIKICLLLLILPLISYTQSIEELESLLKSDIKESERIKTLNELAWQYRKTKFEKALIYANEAFELAIKLNNKEEEATALNRRGIIYKYQGDYKRAIDSYQAALAIEKKRNNIHGIGRANYQLGNVFDNLGLYEEALSYYKLALVYFEENKDDKNIGKTRNQIGLNLTYLRKYDEAILELEIALNIREELKDSLGIANTVLNLGLLYQRLNKYEQANDYLQLSLNYFEKEGKKNYDYLNILLNIANNHYLSEDFTKTKLSYQNLLEQLNSFPIPILEAAAYNGLGNIYKEENDFDKSKFYFLKSLELYEQLNDLQAISLVNKNLGLIYRELKKDIDESIFYLEKANSVVDSTGDLLLKLNILENLGQNYSEIENWEKSAKAYENYSHLKNSLEETTRKALDIKEKLEREAERLKMGKEKQELIIIGLIILILLIIGLSFFAFKAYRSKQETKLMAKNNSIKQQEIDKLLQNIELKSTYARIEGQDDERKRIAKDLHDRLGAILSTVKLYFKAVDDKIDELKIENQEQYQKAHELLDEAVKEVRAIAHDMQSSTLSKFGLIPEIEDLVNTLKASKQINILFFHFGIEERLDNSVEVQIYRIIQELVSNVLKHAEASKITVQVTKEANSVNILVEDNGKGFNVDSVDKGMGLKNIESRVDNLNGRLIVDSMEGKGTTISVDIEIDNKNENND